MKQLFALLLAFACSAPLLAADTTRYIGTRCEVPVNIYPLVDSADETQIEPSVAYNAAGMQLVWIFETPGGEITTTSITPAASGNFRWSHLALAMYELELAPDFVTKPGTGRLVGVCNGVRHWRGPFIEFVEAKGQ